MAQHAALERGLGDRLERESVGECLELLLVVERHPPAPCGLDELGLEVPGVADTERALAVGAVLGLAQRRRERVGAHNSDWGDRCGDRHLPVIAVRDVDVSRRPIAAELDVLGSRASTQTRWPRHRLRAVSKCSSDPISASRNRNASRLSTTSYSSETILRTSPVSSRRFALNPLAGISSAGCRVPGAVVFGPFGPSDDEHVALGDPPAESRLVEGVVDRARVFVEYHSEAAPGHFAHAEHAVVAGDSVRHVGAFTYR